MRCLIVACLFAVASAQLGINFLQNFRDWFNTNKNDFSIDFVHNYRFEEHDTNAGYHLLVAISDVSGDKACHLIEVTPDWEKDLEDINKVHVISEEIYHLISTHTLHESTMTYNDLSNIYGDSDALRECVQHRLYIVNYKPSYLNALG